MPKRIVHGEGIWNSDKLGLIEPLWVRPEYANLIPLALANGVFEVNSKKIWATVYAYNRPEITVERVEEMFACFEKVGLLFKWVDPASGKSWGFWVGIDKAGRLPSASRLKKGHDSLGPVPPLEALREYKNQTGANQWPTNGQVGFGSGLGSGNTTGSDANASDESILNSTASEQASPEAVQLAELLKQRILKNNPGAKITLMRLKKWITVADLMITRDHRTSVAIRELIEFSQADNFWRANILSMEKLREKFDQLWLKRNGVADFGPVPVKPERRSELDDAGRARYAAAGVRV